MFVLMFLGTALGVSALGRELYVRQRSARPLARAIRAAVEHEYETPCEDPQTALEALRRNCHGKRHRKPTACSRKAA